jgi:hypothetical protein
VSAGRRRQDTEEATYAVCMLFRPTFDGVLADSSARLSLSVTQHRCHPPSSVFRPANVSLILPQIPPCCWPMVAVVAHVYDLSFLKILPSKRCGAVSAIGILSQNLQLYCKPSVAQKGLQASVTRYKRI